MTVVKAQQRFQLYDSMGVGLEDLLCPFQLCDSMKEALSEAARSSIACSRVSLHNQEALNAEAIYLQ